MLKLIVQHSPNLLAFLCGLHLRLSKPQWQHVLRLADAQALGVVGEYLTRRAVELLQHVDALASEVGPHGAGADGRREGPDAD